MKFQKSVIELMRQLMGGASHRNRLALSGLVGIASMNLDQSAIVLEKNPDIDAEIVGQLLRLRLTKGVFRKSLSNPPDNLRARELRSEPRASKRF
jgi:hypothetical protein